MGKYKSAPEMFAERQMSETARRTYNELLDAIFAQIIDGVAAGRGLDAARVRELVDAAPSTADEYMLSGLADGVADRSEILEHEGLGESEELRWDTYIQVDPRDMGLRGGPAIALIFGDGLIVQSARGGNPGTRIFGADTVAKALKHAGEDEDIRAIVLRINSGGGSALASDAVWRELRRVREKKPVVVSMADAAASGGYYIASGANAVLAEPATLTGSIGVFFLRPALAGLFRKLEISSELLTRGRFAALGAMDEPFTPEERERASTFVGAMYDDFLERVSTGRGISKQEVDRLGQGRIWLGESALEQGLVDELGGLYAAVRRAQQEAGLDAEADPERVIFPGPRSLTEEIRDLMQGDITSWLSTRILPLELPAILRAASFLAEGELAYLPTDWIEIY